MNHVWIRHCIIISRLICLQFITILLYWKAINNNNNNNNIATEIHDLILSPPIENQYTNLIEKLIQHTAASQPQYIQQLLNTEELSDRKPTQFLQRLQQLAGSTVRNKGMFIQELFLPANVCMVLASFRYSTSIYKLAQLADKVMEVAIIHIKSSCSTKSAWFWGASGRNSQSQARD